MLKSSSGDLYWIENEHVHEKGQKANIYTHNVSILWALKNYLCVVKSALIHELPGASSPGPPTRALPWTNWGF